MLNSCHPGNEQSRITSGKIDYKIIYLNQDLDKKTADLLPKKMKLIFNEKQAANHIEGFLGFYKLNAITDFQTRKCSTILKVFDNHYLFKGRRDEPMCCFDTMEDMVIRETGEVKEIAGFTCKKSIVYLPSTQNTFTIYTTDEIYLKHPNATNPYKKVKGVLMEFELNLLHLKMRFVAEKFHPLDSGNLMPEMPQHTKLVDRNQMTHILKRLME
jgi:hypothetical protein